MKPLIVAALQSPTLLNIWARSDLWRLETAYLGDHDLAENCFSSVPRYKSGDPLAVLVSSPLQLQTARVLWPRSKIVWVHHNARVDLFPDEWRDSTDHRVALADSIAQTQLAQHSQPGLSVIVPCYLPQRKFRWRPDALWTMMSRPQTRHEEHLTMMTEMVKHVSDFTIYGEGQPAGFLNETGKATLIQGSSAYVSCLPPWSGFGLAEHEMFAAGVPVIGPRWADIVTEMPEEYLTLGTGIDANILAARMLTRCKSCAERIGDMGLEFVAQYRTRQRMESGIAKFLEAVS